MDRSDIIYLIDERWREDEYGVKKPVQHAKKRVFASAQSVTGTEVAEFGRNGINPEIRFVVFYPDYNGERLIVWNNQFYSVYRTYRAKTDALELYCERRGGTGGEDRDV